MSFVELAKFIETAPERYFRRVLFRNAQTLIYRGQVVTFGFLYDEGRVEMKRTRSIKVYRPGEVHLLDQLLGAQVLDHDLLILPGTSIYFLDRVTLEEVMALSPQFGLVR